MICKKSPRIPRDSISLRWGFSKKSNEFYKTVKILERFHMIRMTYLIKFTKDSQESQRFHELLSESLQDERFHMITSKIPRDSIYFHWGISKSSKRFQWVWKNFEECQKILWTLLKDSPKLADFPLFVRNLWRISKQIGWFLKDSQWWAVVRDSWRLWFPIASTRES